MLGIGSACGQGYESLVLSLSSRVDEGSAGSEYECEDVG